MSIKSRQHVWFMQPTVTGLPAPSTPAGGQRSVVCNLTLHTEKAATNAHKHLNLLYGLKNSRCLRLYKNPAMNPLSLTKLGYQFLLRVVLQDLKGGTMSFKRHLCQTEAIVSCYRFLSYWTLNLSGILKVSCSSLQRCSLHKQVQSLKPQ